MNTGTNSAVLPGSTRTLSIALCAAFLLARPVPAQHCATYEEPTYSGTPDGTVITGQDGFYVPVADSQDGLVYSYFLNSLGFPANTTGGSQFVAVEGGDTGLPVPFARAQRDMTYDDGTGTWTISFDIAVTYTGDLPSAQNIGSFSTQTFASPNPSEQTFIALATWTDPVTAANWNADYVWFDAAGTQLTESVGNAGFQNLLVNHWYRWCTTFSLDTNAITEVSITDLTSGTTVTQTVIGRFMFGGTTGSATGPPTGFRYFAGSATAAGNVLGFDNLEVLRIGDECPTGAPCPTDIDGDGSTGVLDLVALIGAWGPNPGHPADFDGNGSVGVLDLIALIGAWGPCP